jgi:dUTP pyrophosphatase
MKLGIYKCDPRATLPVRATTHSACWDIHACVLDGTRVDSYSSYNEFMSRLVVGNQLEIYPGERVLVPTGLIFEIPLGYSMRIHPRSGFSFKKGMALSNCEGVIDADYTLQTFVSMINHSDISCKIEHGERIAQIELVPVHMFDITEIPEAPQPFTERKGGFGSTGIT